MSRELLLLLLLLLLWFKVCVLSSVAAIYYCRYPLPATSYPLPTVSAVSPYPHLYTS